MALGERNNWEKIVDTLLSETEYLSKADAISFLMGSSKEHPKTAYIAYSLAPVDYSAVVEDPEHRVRYPFKKRGGIYLDLERGEVVFLFDKILTGPKKALDEYGKSWALEDIDLPD